MTEGLIESVIAFLDGILPRELIAMILSASPILELRGGMIAARLLQVPFWTAYILCIIGNLIPIPFVLLFIRKVIQWLKKTKWFHKIGAWLENKTEKNKDKVLKYSAWGLLLFVAIPLPGTGAWTGALVAAMLDMPLRKSFPIIAVGVVSAATIVALVSYGLPALFGYSVG